VRARLTTFAYPWDLARLGVERTLEGLVADGFDSIHLAATYHPIDAVSPRDGAVRLFTSARGAVHFPARRERYGRIEPSTSSPDICAAWPDVTARAASIGLDVVPWTIVLYQPWIADRYPDCARVLPSGDRIEAGVCAANDDVREYVTALCGDIVDQFGVGTLHLEGVIPASYDYGLLRPRVLVDVPRRARELLAVCFCASCRRRGASAGLDTERLQRLVNDAVAVDLGMEPSGSTPDPEAASDDAELRAFVANYVRASVELVEMIASHVQSGGAPRLSTIAWGPFNALLGEASDASFAELLGAFDQVYVSARATNDRTRVALDARAQRGLELAVLLAPSDLGAVTAMAATPPAKGSERIASELRAAADLGAAEIALYNYGLLRETDVRRLAAAMRAAFV
jgi:hypothetical protein